MADTLRKLEEAQTVKLDREEYKEIMDTWASIDELDQHVEYVKFFKDGMPEAWSREYKGIPDSTSAGEGAWVRIQDHGVNEDNWLDFCAQVMAIRTNLSKREAELYVLKEKSGLTTMDAAEEMDITVGNARGKLGKIRSKIVRAEKTAELEI